MTIAYSRGALPALALLAATFLAGCATAPRFNEHFGESVHANLSAQVLNPAAAANRDPVLGIDGNAARAGQERYQRTFKEPDGGREQPLVGGGSQQ